MQKEDTQQPHKASTVGCSIAAWGSFHAGIEQIEACRQPDHVGGNPVPANFLRHADEQTVAAVVAVNQTHDRAGIGVTDFRNWGVLGCLQAPGRTVVGLSLTRFTAEGAWGVSPHIVPHRCLHSLSGTLSLGLKCEGPNFGVGEPEAVLPLACIWLAQKRVAGVWAVISCMEPEFPPTLGEAAVPAGNVAHAVVLALQPDSETAPLRLSIQPTSGPVDAPWDIFRLENWLQGQCSGAWPLPGGLKIERKSTNVRAIPVPASGVSSLQGVRG